MPPRSNPTARQVRLGSELRRLRERSGVTAREAAAAIELDQAKMSHLEAGRVAVGANRVRRLTAHYRVADRALVDALAAMAGERIRGWWEAYRGALPQGFLDLAELEYHASCLRTLEITQIPGLLQTEEHARAVFEYVSTGLSPQAIDARVACRMRRREILEREAPLPFEAVIHEAALRIRVGDRKVARAQLKALLEASERANVMVRVIPFDVDGFASAGYSMLYVAGPVPQLDTVQLDTVHSGVLLDTEAQLSKHRGLYEKVRGHALGPVESQAFIHKVALET